MQFSLKTMMIGTFIAAMMCAFAFTLPRSLTSLFAFAINVLLPSVLIPSIVYGNSDQRAFAIGATASFTTMVFSGGVRELPFPAIRLLVVPLLTLLGGWLALRTRDWLACRSSPAVAPPPVGRRQSGDR